MSKKILIAAIGLIALLVFSTIAIAQGPGGPPSPPNASSQPKGPTADEQNQPLKERLEAFYIEKENYINQKRRCKEMAVQTNAPSGTCWDEMKPVMIGILLKQLGLTKKRLEQLKEKSIVIPNIDEIGPKLEKAKAVFEASGSSKITLKATAKEVEDIINQIEEAATVNQADVLIKQMDNLMVKADELVSKLDAKLGELRSAGNEVRELEKALDEFKVDLAKTKESITKAKAKYAEMKSAKEISKLAKEVRAFIDAAKNSLEKGFDKARKIVPMINDSDKGGNGQTSNGTADTGGSQ